MFRTCALALVALVAYDSVGQSYALQQRVKDVYEQRNETFFAEFKVKLAPNKYDNFTIQVFPEWAPIGAARFKKLVKAKYFKGNRFYKIVPDFLVQFGIHGDPDVNEMWADKTLKDDQGGETNDYGLISFCKSSPNVPARSTQVYINLEDNNFLDMTDGFPPFGMVADEGMTVVEKVYTGYGDQPDAERLTMDGNVYLKKHYPKLSFITDCEWYKKRNGVRVQKNKRRILKELEAELEEAEADDE